MPKDLDKAVFLLDMSELVTVFLHSGWTADKMLALRTGDLLGQVLDVCEGRAKIVHTNHVIDLDGEPHVPKGMRLAPEAEQLPDRLRGKFHWDATEFVRLFNEGVRNGDWVPGCLQLPVQLLDYLLAHPYLIPVELEGRSILFWGHIYYGVNDGKYIRMLYWNRKCHIDGNLAVHHNLADNCYKP